jgi:anti-sigma factor RsiW
VKPISDSDLQAYVDGALSTVRHAEVADYLDAHPTEAARIGDYIAQSAVRAAYASVIDEAVPAELNIATMIATASQWAERNGCTSDAIRGGGHCPAVDRGVTGWQLNTWNHPRDAGLPALAREAAASYAVYAEDNIAPWRSAPMTVRH